MIVVHAVVGDVQRLKQPMNSNNKVYGIRQERKYRKRLDRITTIKYCKHNKFISMDSFFSFSSRFYSTLLLSK